jgi:hypothetical protein
MATPDPRQELYRLWFEFLKRAVEAGHPIDAEYYDQWLPVDGLTFNQWWGRFRKQLSVPSVRLLSSDDTVPPDALVMVVPQGMNKVMAFKEIKALLDAQLDGMTRHVYGRYAPTEGSNIKYAAFRLMLHCYDSEMKTDSKGKKASREARVRRVIERYDEMERKYGATQRRIDKIPKALNVNKGIGVGTDDLLRNYYRAVQKAKRIVGNVARGDFPGKYT